YCVVATCLLLLKSIPRSLKTLTERALAPFECRIADHALSTQVPFLSYCDAIYACVAAFALKMPLKFSRYCRKTRIHNTQATRAGAMVPGDIVRGNARMLYSSAASSVSASGPNSPK